MLVLFVTADHPFAGYAGSFVYARSILGLLGQIADVTIASLELTSGRHLSSVQVPTLFPAAKVVRGGKLASQVRSVLTTASMVEAQFDVERSAIWVDEMLNEMQPDLVVFNHLRSGWLIPRLAPHWQRRSVYLAHNAEGVAYRSVASLQPTRFVRMLVRRGAAKIGRLEERVVSAAASTWCIAKEDGQRLAVTGGTSFHVIPPVADPKPIPARSDPRRLLLVGSFNWQAKRHNAAWLVFDVWPSVRGRFPEWELHIVGAGAAKLGKRLASVPGVSVFSDVASVDPFFMGGGIFVVPERQQGGVKLKTLEAAAWGLPIVTTMEGVEGTPLEDEKSCLVARGADAFSGAVMRMIVDPGLGRALGSAASSRVADFHSSDAVRARFMSAMAEWSHCDSERP